MTERTGNVLRETARILRGEHPGYAGLSDCIRNASSYLRCMAISEPATAIVIAAEIRGDLMAASDISGLHPERCEWAANRLDGKL